MGSGGGPSLPCFFSVRHTSGQVGPKYAGQDLQALDNIVARPLKWYNYSRIKQRKGLFV